MTPREIADRLALTRKHTYRLLEGRASARLRERQREISTRWRNGASVRAIASALARSEPSILATLYRTGAKCRSIGART